MRHLYLQNSLGERKDLGARENFIINSSGFGTSNDTEYERLGDGFYSQSLLEATQINIVGEITFNNSQYADYKTLIDWIYSGYDLTVVYCPVATEYFCDVDIDYIEKGESKGSYLSCPVSFLGKTAWYEATPIIMNFGLDPDIEYMVFDFPIEAMFALSDSYNSLDIINMGHYPARVKLTANGEMASPILTLKNKTTGEVLGKLDLTGTIIDDGEMLKYSSVPGNSYITLVAADGTETDLTDSINLANDNFLSIPVNTSCTLKFEFTGPSTTSTLNIQSHRRTV